MAALTDGERLASEVPDTRLIRLENAGHWLQQYALQESSREVMRFLEVRRQPTFGLKSNVSEMRV